MKLFYYKDEIGNFGDDLNPWMWEKLIPNFLDEDSSELFVGIGTLLNQKIPKAPVKHIFGSGAGYGLAPIVDKTWKIHALRGPATAKALNVSSELVITDSAILIAKIVPAISNEQGEVGFMPHYISDRLANWKQLAEESGFVYISPQWSVEQILSKLATCKLLYTEAMHGAIVADSLRLPWVPLVLGAHVNAEKWSDWLLTLNMNYEPVIIDTVYDAERGFSFKQKAKNEIKRLIVSSGFGKGLYPPPTRKSTKKQINTSLLQLQDARKNKKIYLSEEYIHKDLISRYEIALRKLVG